MNYKKNILSLCALTLLTASSSALAVDYSVFATTPKSGNDAVRFDQQGNLFVSNAGTYTNKLVGTAVYKITPDGTVTEAVTGLSGPLGSDFDSLGNMYVANANNGTITKVTPAGESSVFITLGGGKYGGASGIVINDNDDIFVSSYGDHVIYKINLAGEAETWIEGIGLNGPVGIALDEEENIYVGNYEDQRIFKIDSAKNVTELSPSLGNSGYITYANGAVYSTNYNANRIYRIPVDGGPAVELDGSSQAGFNFVNGITPNADGTKLYVSNWQSNEIMVIENLDEVEPKAPKAVSDSAQVDKDSEVTVDILANDIAGDVAIDAASVMLAITAQNGETVIDDSNGAVTYTPNSSFSGGDSFVYTVSDVDGLTSNEATVTVIVNDTSTTTTTTTTTSTASTPEKKKSSGGGTFAYLAALLIFARVLKSS